MAVWVLFRWARCSRSGCGCGPRSASSATADRHEILSRGSKATKTTQGSSAGRPALEAIQAIPYYDSCPNL